MEIGGKKKAEGDLAKCMPSLRDYGSINIGKARRVHNNGSSMLSRFKIGGNRHEYVLLANAYGCAKHLQRRERISQASISPGS
jgi:hypothetical protein